MDLNMTVLHGSFAWHDNPLALALSAKNSDYAVCLVDDVEVPNAFEEAKKDFVLKLFFQLLQDTACRYVYQL